MRKIFRDGIKSEVLIEILRALYDLPRGALDEVIENAIELHDNDVSANEYWVDLAEDLDNAFDIIGSAGPFGTGRNCDV
jgi:hypothetical protein